MRRRYRQFLSLAGLTALEAIRQPICLLLTTTCVVLIGLVPQVVMHNFGESGKLVRDSGLALHFVFGLFVATTAASSTLSREIRSGTASAVLSKPVSRELLFLAKFAGIATVILAFSAIASVATLLAERAAEDFGQFGENYGYVTDHRTGLFIIASAFAALGIAAFANYRWRRAFGSTSFVATLLLLLVVLLVSGCFEKTGEWAPYDMRVTWRLLPASALIALALITLAAIAIALSTRLGTLPTLTLGGVIFLVGLMSDYLVGRHADHSPVASLLYRVLPNWQHFWICDALDAGKSIPWFYVFHAGCYAAVVTAGVLCLGMLAFRQVDMK
jgi:ABC-type transport system involved in multi-copper enzyme maturation permease subunit